MFEHRLAQILLFTTFILLLLGGIVHGTGSSLACPDWPTCYGSLMPEMKGNIAIEHGHRLLASAVGLMTILNAVLLWRRRRGERSLRYLGLAAVGLVVFQGILGGITVLYQLPTAISTAHLATSMLFFSLINWIVWKTSPTAGVHTRRLTSAFESSWVRLTTFFVYLQIVLGALVRHTGAGIVCNDIPFCNGHAWPSSEEPLMRLHMLHRWYALVVAFFVLMLPLVLKRLRKTDLKIRFFTGVAPFLIVGQIGLGLWSVASSLGLWPVTAHLGIGALLLATMVALSYSISTFKEYVGVP